jgi:biofilm protein TabA
MTKTMTIISTMVTLATIAAALVAQSDSRETWTKQKSKAWFEERRWLKGLSLIPHDSVDQVEFAQQYHLHQSLWDSAFAFLGRQGLKALPKGKYPIDGNNVFASVTEDSTKDFERTRWESHRKYADIQYVISGEEKIGICRVSDATVTQVYDEKGDVAHYSATGTLYLASSGTFFVFFPSDAHRPNITTGGNRVDKKIVIKVRVDGNESK